MKKNIHISKKILFGLLLLLLFLPMVQQSIKVVKLTPLKGSFSIPEKPKLSFSTWFEGSYQMYLQDYLDESIGFRPFFVRVYNQIHYSLYNNARANSVIIGKEKYLYEENYIKAYLGRDYIGRDKIEEKVSKLQLVSDVLKTNGTDLIVLLAPGKGSFYPEYIPERYEPQRKDTTNFEVYLETLKKSRIRLLDFHTWFLSHKDTSPYPLFPKTGIHWSRYGEVLVADSILKYIALLRKDLKLAQITFEKVETSRKMQGTDEDIEEGMNLLFDIRDLEMGYPQFQIMKDSTTDCPKVLSVADSYYWGMFNWGLSKHAFNNSKFWFYNQQIYPDSYENPLFVKDIDIIDEVQKNEAVILISTDANLFKFAFGFIDQLYDAYHRDPKYEEILKREKKIQYYIHAIKESPEWLNTIKKQAKDKNISLREAVRQNAEYEIWLQEQNEGKD